MSEFWQGIVVGALLAIPVGIATNLLTIPIQNALNRRVKVTSDKKAVEDAQFEAQAKEYARDRTLLWSFLLEVLIRAAFIGALTGVVSGFFTIVGQGSSTAMGIIYSRGGLADSLGLSITLVQNMAYLAAQGTALLGALLIMNLARTALRMLSRVRTIRAASANSPPASSTSSTQTPAS